jgi:single-stranded-DNA-specific exonuclease
MTQRSLTGATWIEVDVAPDHVADVRARTGLSAAAARCVAARFGPESLDRWARPTLADLHDPMDMANMEAALDRLQVALKRGQHVRIITDYDVDGTTSSLILQAALRLAQPGNRLDYHIPNRFGEGYGFSVGAAKAAAADGVDLIVTADIGVRDHAAVDAARSAGVDVLICDHHLPAGEAVPDGATVLCPPQAGCDYPNPHLAACGVSLKLATALLADHPKHDAIVQSMLKLAAVGTVADLVPLTTRENRAIVSLGLEQLNRGRHHPGLEALLDVCRLSGPVGTSDLGFKLGPRINAAGRVADAKLVVELLNTRDRGTARQLAEKLDGLNQQRRTLQRRLEKEAMQQLEQGGDASPFVIVAGREDEGWHRGVVGIVASRVKDAVHRPTAVVSIQGETAVGSVRSVSRIHAVKALESAQDLLIKFGGHPAAAGFTTKTENLDALRERLSSYVTEAVPLDELAPVRKIDAFVEASDLGRFLLRELEQLGPFGMGNPTPRLAVRGVRPTGVQVRGATGALMRFRIPGAHADAVWWQQAQHAEALEQGSFDLLGSLVMNRYKGNSSVRFEVKDAAPSAT